MVTMAEERQMLQELQRGMVLGLFIDLFYTRRNEFPLAPSVMKSFN